MQGVPAGLPPGIPGMGEEIEGAMQHAPQLVRQFSTIWNDVAAKLEKLTDNKDFILKIHILRNFPNMVGAWIRFLNM